MCLTSPCLLLMLWTAFHRELRYPIGGSREGGHHDTDRNRRVGYRKICLSGPRSRCRRASRCPPAPFTGARLDVFREAGSVSCWDPGLQHLTSLGAGTYGTRARGTVAARAICAALCKAGEERRG